MTLHRSIILGLALLAGAATSAGAADLGSLKDDAMPGEMGTARWYLRADLGYAWFRNPDASEVDLAGNQFDLSGESMDNSWFAGGGIGVYFSDRLRADVTVERIWNTQFHANNEGVSAPFAPGDRQFDINSTVVLANLYYDFALHSGFDPYVGAGIGWAHNKAHNGFWTGCTCSGEIASGDESDFAWALMAGLTIDLGRHEMGSIKDDGMTSDRETGWKLDVGYRYLNFGDVHTGQLINDQQVPVGGDPDVKDMAAHEVRVGLRYDIW